MRKNLYARKRQHKYHLKKKHARKYSVYDAGMDERKSRAEYAKELESGHISKWSDCRNGGYNYWVDYYLSGPRSYAKYCTNRKIRAKYRNIASHGNHEDVLAMKGAQYEKEYDYAYTIW